MSQAKVDRYKEEKKNRKKIMAAYAAGVVVIAAIIGWAGYSGYRAYENNKPMETIYANLDSISSYMNSLNSEQ